MAKRPDTPKVARKRQREMRTVSQMIALYCAGNHSGAVREQRALCGEPVCEACKQLDDYARLRTSRCPRMAEKANCDGCPHPCYAPAMREQVQRVMRYAGPCMLTKHPIAALRHLVNMVAARRGSWSR